MDKVLQSTDWVTCPYDPNHIMKYSKFHNHFVKCKDAHPNDPRVQCPYYASELIHPDNLKEHLLSCQYKTLYADLYFDSSKLPVYEAPCHVNYDEESGAESDDDKETVITVGRSSLFSGTTRRSTKSYSTVSQPFGKVRQNNVIIGKPTRESYAFKYIEEDVTNDSMGELLRRDDSGNCSRSSSSPSNQSTMCTPSSGNSSSVSSPSIPASPIKPFERKVGLGRGKVIQKLMSSSTSSLESCGGTGRGAWFRANVNLN